MKQLESQEQQALFRWAAVMEKSMPILQLLHSIPNGGKRDIWTAARLKAEGVKAGVSDIFLPVANNGYYGLYIELKVRGGKLSDRQKWWIESTMAQGYLSVVCMGWEAAAEEILRYLERG